MKAKLKLKIPEPELGLLFTGLRFGPVTLARGSCHRIWGKLHCLISSHSAYLAGQLCTALDKGGTQLAGQSMAPVVTAHGTFAVTVPWQDQLLSSSPTLGAPSPPGQSLGFSQCPPSTVSKSTGSSGWCVCVLWNVTLAPIVEVQLWRSWAFGRHLGYRVAQ